MFTKHFYYLHNYFYIMPNVIKYIQKPGWRIHEFTQTKRQRDACFIICKNTTHPDKNLKF